MREKGGEARAREACPAHNTHLQSGSGLNYTHKKRSCPEPSTTRGCRGCKVWSAVEPLRNHAQGIGRG